MNRRDFLGTAAVGVTGALVALADSSAQPAPPDRGTAWLCLTCGTQFPATVHPPLACPICQDSRQYVGLNGQQWTTLDELRQTHENEITEEEPGVYSIHTKPNFAINQRAFLIKTTEGNVLWDCVALLDEKTKAEIRRLGGISAIAISHPHFYTTMIEWSRAFEGAPIYLHELNRQWVMRPDPSIRFWSGEVKRLTPNLTLIKTGGHFDGFQVLHWSRSRDANGVLLAGDQPDVCMDRNWVTFMYSYPNYIPLNRAAIQGIVAALNPYSFERLHGAFTGQFLTENAKKIVSRSAERYLAAIS
jgi:hypothetical protein